ncbi:rhomboid family intramembrane serine protease [Candidatus Atribacteria bacterium MT.SAG.1]|nr:rhomboid family intramembrane serine protease [Candidatus Atribacteria bacterium MT.SAG.1]
MFPLWDDVPTKKFPLITIILIVLNSIVYLYQMSLGERFNEFIYSMGLLPFEITHNIDIFPPGPSPIYLTIFFSMFMHGSIVHLLGNMLFLWIFGNNVEDYLGRKRFIIFYLFSGTIAAFTQIFFNSDSIVPMVGASGAIAGVLGAYLLLYPRAKVTTVIIFGFFIRLIKIPAVVVLSFWIIYQFLYGISSLAVGTGEGGVAWFAHIGGFISGIIIIKLFKTFLK